MFSWLNEFPNPHRPAAADKIISLRRGRCANRRLDFIGGEREFKRFNIRDGLGIVLARRAA